MSISISEAQARLIYLDYHTRGNTMGTSAQEMGAIVSQFSDKIHTWQSSVDSNQYEWDDSDYEQFIESGKEVGRDATGGFERSDNRGDIAKAAGDMSFTTIGAVGGFAMGKIVAKKVTEDVAKNVVKETVKEGSKAAGKSAAERATAAFSSYFAITLAVITAAIYWIKKPNKDGAKACEDMINPLANSQGALQQSQQEMDSMQQEMVNLSDQAATQNDSANTQIVEAKTDQDYYHIIYKSLKQKMDSGKKLRDDEKALYKLAANNINNTGKKIGDIVEENSLIITDIHASMDTYQDGYNYVAETMGEAQGLAEYSASFDKQTRVLSYVEGAAQSLNAASAFGAATKLATTSGVLWWNYIIAALGFGAAASSGIAAGQQFKFASTAGNTIEQREIAENLNVETRDKYDIEIDNYAVLMQATESLEVAVPEEDIKVDPSISSKSVKKEPKKEEEEE